MRILAVDDEHSILEVLTTALESFGSHQVEAVTSGAEALARLEEADYFFDCLLLDIQMPVMNGVDLCREIRKDPDYARAPIVMLTAMSQMKYVDQAFAAGATDYVTKPFDFTELRERLSRARRVASKNAWVVEGERAADKTEMGFYAARKPDFSLPCSATNDEQAIGHAEFENYVIQITETRPANSWVIGVKLHEAREYYDSLSLSDFRDRLSAVVEALSRAFGTAGTLISYRGSGVFLCVGHSTLSLTDKHYEVKTNRALGRLDGDLAGMSVILGDRMPLNAVTKAGNMRILSEAIEMVEIADQSRNQVLTVPRRLLSFRKRTREEDHLEQSAYEVILRDLLRGNLGAWDR